MADIDKNDLAKVIAEAVTNALTPLRESGRLNLNQNLQRPENSRLQV